MLFNSYTFVLLFLPLTLAGFWLAGGLGNKQWAKSWLVLASLFFYGWWNPVYLVLIVCSVAFNFLVGSGISRQRQAGHRGPARLLQVMGVAANLGVLGYFKYAYFAVANLHHLFGGTFNLGLIVLPLGISFFTFQQIAYLVDAAQGKTSEYNLVDYALFVTFFPQLIAGPIVHHGDVLPQFARKGAYRFRARNLSVGTAYFTMGLFKKVVLADSIAVYATPVFDAAAGGIPLSFAEAWGGVLAYTFQLYFDFSAYSDMAIGLGQMFGIRLPLNFNSPYKALNISDFWRRWHITLSQFLRDYLYIPLGGNRRGTGRRYGNLMITMLLGGLWHGAGWTFVVWGGLHGLFLSVHHGWQAAKEKLGRKDTDAGVLARGAAWLLTFVLVVVGWVFFRAADFQAAWRLLTSMFGGEGIALPAAVATALHLDPAATTAGLRFDGTFRNGLVQGTGWLWVVGLLLMSVAAPNVRDVMQRYRPVITHRRSVRRGRSSRVQWFPSLRWACVILVLSFISLLKLADLSEFLYFQF